MAATLKQVTFSEDVDCFSRNEDFGNSSSEESFHKITTSEADSMEGSTSDEEDASTLDMIMQAAYSCNPSTFSGFVNEPAQRNSLLLYDKDLRGSNSSGNDSIQLYYSIGPACTAEHFQ